MHQHAAEHAEHNKEPSTVTGSDSRRLGLSLASGHRQVMMRE